MKKISTIRLTPVRVSAVFLCAILSGCGGEEAEAPAVDSNGSAPPAPTNRIELPTSIRANLGIRFARVERRSVRGTLRLAGTFETPPSARREYRAALPGRVEVAVKQYDRVQSGRLLWRLVSPAWREIQKSLGTRQTAIESARDEVISVRATRQEAEAKAKLLKRRIREQLESITATLARRRQQRESLTTLKAEVSWLERMVSDGGGDRRADLANARVSLATVAASVTQREETLAMLRGTLGALETEQAELLHQQPRLLADVRRSIREQRSAEDQYQLALNAAAARIGLDGKTLAEAVGGTARWRKIDDLEVKAKADGIVDRIEAVGGSWVEEGALVVATVDPSSPRFRAIALQCDFACITPKNPARIVAARGTIGLDQGEDAADATIEVALEADPHRRTFQVLAIPRKRLPWMRAGVSAHLELVVDGTAKKELAIPTDCIVRDGLEAVFFRRDPSNPDCVVRVVAEIGASDGAWIVIFGGAMEGDEIVREGAYELKLSGRGKPRSATSGAGSDVGHFHADGTWHAGPDH